MGVYDVFLTMKSFINLNRVKFSVIALLFISSLLFYFPSLLILNSYWMGKTDAYSHGYLMLGVVIYFLFSSRKKIFHFQNNLSNHFFVIALLGLLLCSILWFLTYFTQIEALHLFAIILLVWFWGVAVFGKQAVSFLSTSVVLLTMTIPLWDSFIIYFQGMTVFTTQLLLSWFGVVTFFDGNFIHLADGVLEVSEGCSGLKYFLAGASIAIIYAEMNVNTIYKKIIIFFIGAGISIIANWIRVFSLVLIADFSKMQSSLVEDHDSFGWLVFAVCIVCFFYIVSNITPGVVSKEVIKKVNSNDYESKLINNIIFRAVSAALIASIFPILSWSIPLGNAGEILSHSLKLEQAISIEQPSWVPNYSGFDKSEIWTVMDSTREIGVTIYSYINQQQGKELVNYANTINSREFKVKKLPNIIISNNKSVNRYILTSKTQNLIVAWYYMVGFNVTNNENIAKILQIPSAFQGVPIASLITLHLDCEEYSCDVEEKALTSKLVEKISASINVKK